MPSDVEAALQVLFADVPPGLRLCNGLLPLITVAQVYAIVRDRTEVDHTVEELRASGKLRTAQLGPRRSELLLARATDCDAVLGNTLSMQHHHIGADGLDSLGILSTQVVKLLMGHSTSAFILTGDIAAALNDSSVRHSTPTPPKAVDVAHHLAGLGWIRPSRAATGAGPNEAPIAEGEEWMWSFPDSGSLVNGLLQARHEVLCTLKRQRLGRASLQLVQNSTKVISLPALWCICYSASSFFNHAFNVLLVLQSILRVTKLDLRYVLRDMEGLELIVTEQPGLRGCSLYLTPQGQQEVVATSSKGRKRQR
uniref:Uncharacterized protein n=1 Tax=Chrysotila carterae TaxID=13221 RepID=A0A7S4C1B5_CHRCT